MSPESMVMIGSERRIEHAQMHGLLRQFETTCTRPPYAGRRLPVGLPPPGSARLSGTIDAKRGPTAASTPMKPLAARQLAARGRPRALR